MNKNEICAIGVLLSMASCKDGPTTPLIPIDKDDYVEISNKLQKGCYVYSKYGTEISLKIVQNSPEVVGQLNIMHKEKDRNLGTFTGRRQGDKIIANYTFVSEGIESKRQVAYQLKDNQLIEGYGEMDDSGTNFKDTSAIVYNSSMPLVKADCKE